MLAAVALIPLAWLIGEATEHAAEHTGPGIGGFLNATFGNAPELIIALFAVNARSYEVVRGSLTGSVVGNLLLVLGFSLLFGGRGEIDRPSSFLALGLVAGTTVLLLIPSIPGWHGDPERDELGEALDPGLDRPPGRLRGRSPGSRCGGTQPCTSRATRRSRAGRCGSRSLVLGVGDRRHRARRGDSRRLDRQVRRGVRAERVLRSRRS